MDMFLDHHDSKARDAVHVLMACERVRETDLMAAPDVDDSVIVDSHRTLSLASLVRMKLNVFLRKDQMHLIDMLDVGLIDASWVHDLPPELAPRLQELLDNPE